MSSRIVVVARRSDALGRRLGRLDQAHVELEFCADRAALGALLADGATAAVVVGMRGSERSTAVGLIRRVKAEFPAVPIVVVCLDPDAPGREVLAAARAGAEHFLFAGVDDFGEILRTVVTTGDVPGVPAPAGGAAAAAMGTGWTTVPGARPGAGSGGGSGSGLRLRVQSRRQGTPSDANRNAEYRVGRSALCLPAEMPALLRRIVSACVAPGAPVRVAELAESLGMPRRTLAREASRRGWPTLSVLLQWGRLFRAALGAARTGRERVSAAELHRTIAAAGGFSSVPAARRAFRDRAGVSLRDVVSGGVSVLIPPFLEAVSHDPPSSSRRRLAS